MKFIIIYIYVYIYIYIAAIDGHFLFLVLGIITRISNKLECSRLKGSSSHYNMFLIL
jgi:hypothetical protein